MRLILRIVQIGNSKGVAIPLDVREATGATEIGDRIEVDIIKKVE